MVWGNLTSSFTLFLKSDDDNQDSEDTRSIFSFSQPGVRFCLWA